MLQQMAYSLLLFNMQAQLLKAFVLEWTSIFLIYAILLLATDFKKILPIRILYHKLLSGFII